MSFTAIKNIAIAIVILVLVGLIYSYHVEPNEEIRDGNIGTLFLLYLALGIIAGFYVVTVIIPALGDRVGDMVYSSPEKIEKDPTQEAMALLARGEYDEAIDAFREIAKDTPGDRFPIVEIAKIYHEKLNNGEAAISTYEQALDAEDWRENDLAFFLFRLASLHVDIREDFATARGYLERVIAEFPETRHSANATHKMREMEEAEFIAKQKQG